MAKIIVAPIKSGKKTSVTTKRIRSAAGSMLTVRTVDANSPTFSDDISYVFKKNVAKARRAAKK